MLNKIVFFTYVVKAGSFSQAAKNYGISTSAGSRWITELEQHMHSSLLKRTTRKVVTTQAGQLLFDEFSKINPQIDNIVTEIQNLSNEDRGIIRIASTPLFSKFFLAPIIGEYSIICPDVSFRVFNTAFEMDYLDEIDFSIRAIATHQGFMEKDSLLAKRLLRRFPMITCCSPDYLVNKTQPKTPEELKQHKCLYTTTLVGGNHWLYYKNGVYETVEIAQTVEIEDSNFIKTIALQGAGIAYLPKDFIQSELKSGKLIPILEDYTNSNFDFNLYYLPRKQMPKRCFNFKEFLIKKVHEISFVKK